MDGKAITAAIATATSKRTQQSGAKARASLHALVVDPAPIPKRQASKYYAWLADELKYDTSFRWDNGSFRKAGVWSTLGAMAAVHHEPFAKALHTVFEGPSNLAQRPVVYFACAGTPARVLADPDEALVGRFAAIAVLCMAPKKPTKSFAKKLKTLVRDERVLEGAHWVCANAAPTVLYSDVEFAHGLLGLLSVSGSKASKTASKQVLACAKSDTRTGRLIMAADEAKQAASAYDAL